MSPKLAPELQDFRNFLWLVWEHLRLPDPTPIQYDISEYLQHGPKRRIICAFRGVGKSYATSAYACWRLLLEPDDKILVVSASKERSDAFSVFTKRLIWEMPVLQHLKPTEDQRTSNVAFDVGPAKAAHSPSVKSVGITGQMTGSRANIIIADDIETPSNSETQLKRDKISELVKEFDSILIPGGEAIYLGTPQIEASLYNALTERGYQKRVWPSLFPSPAQAEKYAGTLAPYIEEKLEEDPDLVGKSTDPLRFSDDDLLERQLSYGRTGFALQFQLDTSLSDANRYPLKLSDLVVMDLDPEKAPEKVIWCNDPAKELRDVPNVGLTGDRMYRPYDTEGGWAKYDGIVMSIDPSGRGRDETAYAVVAILSGTLFVLDCGGFDGGFAPEVLRKLAEKSKQYKVNEVIVESNMGAGAFTELLKPHYREVYPVTISEVWHSKSKEARILDTLEPVWSNHKLIMDASMVRRDYDSTTHLPPEKAQAYRLMYQATRIQRVKGALQQDDRLDALSMAVGYWVEQTGITVDEGMAKRKEEALAKELEAFEVHAFGQTPQRDGSNWLKQGLS